MTTTTIVAGLLGTSAGLTAMWWTPPAAPERPADTLPHLPVVIAGEPLVVAPDAIRVAAQRHPGPQVRLDLAYTWPDLMPGVATPLRAVSTGGAASASDPVGIDHPATAAADRIYVTIAPAEDTITPAERSRLVHRRFLEPVARRGPAGLEAIAFRDASPYRGEDLVVDPTRAEADRFTARCTREDGRAAPASCSVERRLAGLMVTFRFPRERLGEWRALTAGFDRLLAAWRPGRGA